MIAKITWMILSGFCLCGSLFGQPAASSIDEHRRVLISATVFGFGVKLGQRPDARSTDESFRQLLRSKDAKGNFLYTFNNGNIYAKLFSLCALYKLDKNSFEKLVTELNGEEVVRTSNGCVVGELTVAKIISDIKTGHYDFLHEKTSTAP